MKRQRETLGLRNSSMYWFLACVLMLAGAGSSAQERIRSGQIGISPQNFILDLDQGARTQSYRLHNLGTRPVSVRVELMPFTLDESNTMVALPPEPNSLDQWLVINPLALEIPPGESRAVRFSIRPAVPLPPGEHRVAVVFQEVPQATSADPARQGIAMSTLFRIQSAVYATVGPIARQGSLGDVRLGPDGLATEIESLGNGHVRLDGRLQIWRSDAFPGIGSLPALRVGDAYPVGLVFDGPLNPMPVLPGHRRWISHHAGDAHLPPGRYTVALHGKLGDASISESRSVELRSP